MPPGRPSPALCSASRKRRAPVTCGAVGRGCWLPGSRAAVRGPHREAHTGLTHSPPPSPPALARGPQVPLSLPQSLLLSAGLARTALSRAQLPGSGCRAREHLRVHLRVCVCVCLGGGQPAWPCTHTCPSPPGSRGAQEAPEPSTLLSRGELGAWAGAPGEVEPAWTPKCPRRPAPFPHREGRAGGFLETRVSQGPHPSRGVRGPAPPCPGLLPRQAGALSLEAE